MKRWSAFWRAFDEARVVPRACLAGVGYMTWLTHEWFTELRDPTTAQGVYVSVVYGTIPLILNFYMQNGVNWKDKDAPSGETK